MSPGRAQLWLQVHRAAGAAAFRARWPKSWNPHPRGSAAHLAWARGWAGAGVRPTHVITDPAHSFDVARIH